MQDLSYLQAVDAAEPEPHVVILGPVPCATCGAWVEWAGIEWLALGTHQPHECEPYLAGQRWRRRIEPRTGVGTIPGLTPMENRVLLALRRLILWPAVIGSLAFACLLVGRQQGLW